MVVPGLSGARPLLQDFRAYAGYRYPAALGLMWAGAVAEAVGILALIPLLAIAADSPDVPARLRGWIGESSAVPEQLRFAVALAVFLAAMFLRSLILFQRDLMVSRLSEGYEAALKVRAAAALAAAGWKRAARIGPGGMQSILLADIPRCALAIHYWQIGLVAAIMLVVQLTIAATLSPTMALITTTLIVSGLALSWPWLRKGLRSGAAMSRTTERSSAAAVRLHSGLKAALAQGTTVAFLREYRSTLDELTKVIVGFTRDHALARAGAAAGAAVCAALLLIIGHWLLELPFPLLLTLLILFARMSAPAQQLQQAAQQFAAQSTAYAAMVEHLGVPRDAPEDGPEQEPLRWQVLSLDRVSYSHGEGARGVTNVSFSLSSGEWLGLSGASGAGKTTVADLVAGLFPPDQGQVTVDGERLEGALLDRWRSGLAYVGQTDMVFNDSVRGNLLAEGARADEEALWAALETVGLARRFRTVTKGLDEPIGDRGSSLSGGERQRLVLARALLRRSSLLILDEATNALDPRSELVVLGRLRALTPRPAALLIAHRAAPLELCDGVVAISQGIDVADDA